MADTPTTLRNAYEERFLERARHIVAEYVDEHLGNPKPGYSVYIVWFSKTLENWKALLSTTLPDGMYYEVTHNGQANETYLDVYVKVENRVIR